MAELISAAQSWLMMFAVFWGCTLISTAWPIRVDA
jgi:hypothetical protein